MIKLMIERQIKKWDVNKKQKVGQGVRAYENFLNFKDRHIFRKILGKNFSDYLTSGMD